MSAAPKRPLVAILDYGIGNLRSAQKAFEKAGADARLTSDSSLVRDASAVVLPGVGAYGSCRRELARSGLDEDVRDAVDRSQPLLGICIGMQLLFDGSEESPGVEGLGLLRGSARFLPAGVPRPQMQWNELKLIHPGDPLVAGLGADPWCYFVHSYALDGTAENVVASVEYGNEVAAIVREGQVWATQFHPEKSGDVGQTILRGFLSIASGTA
ncbi:MAG: imidazole glycerol phosphate synthase subunit HisH [Acidimicrobiales bacterium]